MRVEFSFKSPDLDQGGPVRHSEFNRPAEAVIAGISRSRRSNRFEFAKANFDPGADRELIPDGWREFCQLVIHEMQLKLPGFDQTTTVIKHGLYLGNQRIIGIQSLHRTQRRFSQQRSRRSDSVNMVGLIQSPSSTLSRRTLRRNLTSIKPGSHDGDSNMSPPTRRAFNPGPFDTMRTHHLNRSDIPAARVREHLDMNLDPVAVNDADGEAVLMRVDSRHVCCHDVLLLDELIR